MEEIYTVKEAAAILKVSTDYVYDNIAAGKMDCYKVGRSLRVSETHLKNHLASIEQKAEQAEPVRDACEGDEE